MTSNPLSVVHEMVIAWNGLDVDAIVGIFSEDGEFHSMMNRSPTKGREALNAHLTRLFGGAGMLKLNLRNIAVCGNTVFLERLDVFEVNGRRGEIPVAAVLDVEGAHVVSWREYYDRAQLVSQMDTLSE
ncbi:nuclear transport factor 2 family protein [Parahaliea aestuarii]|nr:nuclear transport factor 2 family protein [Parahaliea aestuarii]